MMSTGGVGIFLYLYLLAAYVVWWCLLLIYAKFILPRREARLDFTAFFELDFIKKTLVWDLTKT